MLLLVRVSKDCKGYWTWCVQQQGQPWVKKKQKNKTKNKKNPTSTQNFVFIITQSVLNQFPLNLVCFEANK